jgi:glucose/arabinose dehydrogenase
MLSSLKGLGCIFVIFVAAAGSAGTLPTGFSESVVASGISSPTAMEFAPDGRLFVCQQDGQLRVIKNGVLLATPFLTVTTDTLGERGLLGVAFDPAFAVNHWVYIYYTVPGSTAHNRVSRFTANGDVAVAGSEVVILELNNLSGASNHNGGAIHFGPDGKLYVAVGENANSSNSQTLANLLGKVLRINADGSIPTDNPFYNTASGANRVIWAMGLRNPFTFAFQPGTGRLFINDVGESTWEEINEGVAGANYGWPNCEGGCNSTYRDPIYQYSHSPACAVTGGAFYNPATSQFPPAYNGVYMFSDYCGGWIRILDPANGNQVTTFATGLSSPVDLKVSADGSLYYLARGAGSVYRVQFNAAPGITLNPVDKTVLVGGSATFTMAASGAQPLAYQWQRDSVDIAGANGTSYTIAGVQAQDNGAMFACRVSNAYGSATSAAARLTVTSNQPPVAAILAPVNGLHYNAGGTITYSGNGSDPEDGTLAANAFSWTIVFHHADHTHPFLGPITGSIGGTFTIPTSGETSADVFYRIQLTVTDSAGAQSSTYVDIVPNVVTLTLASNPSSLQLTLDGQPVTAPYSVPSVVGMTRSIGASAVQGNYSFLSWSDGGAQTHNIATPSTDTTYTAAYQASNPPTIVTLTLDSSPSGLQLTFDGQAVTAPYSVQSAVGVTHSIGASETQGNYSFLSWSDGGAPTHNIMTPGSDTTYIATYQTSSPPTVVTLTLVSYPSGLQLTLDGQTVTTPYSEQSVAGATRTIGAPTTQPLGKFNYFFQNWSDSGAQTHNITTPDADTTYSALYRKRGRY